MTRMRRAVRCQYDEFSDHPALRMSGNRTEQGVGSGRVELIGRSIRYSRRNVNMDPVVCEKSTEQKPSRFRGLAIRCGCRFRPNFRNLCGLRWSL